MDHLYAEAKQPHSEAGVMAGRVAAAPGGSIVAEDLFGQAVEREGFLERGLDGGTGLVGAGREGDVEAAVVVEDGERVAALAVLKREVAFEVHLPKFVGCAAFEALAR